VPPEPPTPATREVELSVVVPCFNEEGNLDVLVTRTRRVFATHAIAGELVLVDDGSRDGTGPAIDALAVRHPGEIVAVHHRTNRGITSGWRSGLDHAHGRWVCTIDADLQYRPEDIAVLFAIARGGTVDLVQGRRLPVKRDTRYVMSRGLDLLLKAAFAMPENDVKSGFVVYRREAFADILGEAGRFHHFQHMITVVAKAKGYTLRQVDVPFEERHAGTSFIGRLPLRMLATTFVDIGRGLVAYRFGRGARRQQPAARPDADRPSSRIGTVP
jgi:phenylacetate-CoA ligase